MKLSKTLKLTLRNLLLDVKMGEIKAKENTLIFDGEEYGVGTEVFVKDTENEGEVIVAPDGDYTLIEDDEKVTIIIVRDGKIEEIKGQTETETPETSTETTETSTETETETPETEVEAEVIEVVPADESQEEETKDDSRERLEVLETRMAEMASGMTELLNKLAAAEGRIAVLEEKLAKIEAPAADPVEDKPEVETKMSRLSYLRKK